MKKVLGYLTFALFFLIILGTDMQISAAELDDPQEGREMGYLVDGFEDTSEENGIAMLDLATQYYSKYTSSNYTHNAKFENDVLFNGIDVSKYQKDINWNQVHSDGIEFAIIRVGYRSYSGDGSLNEDPYYEKNIKQALAAGIQVGVYIYSQATTPEEAVEEADFVLSRIANYHVALPIVIDYEYASVEQPNGKYVLGGRLYYSDLSPDQATNVCNAFCNRVRQAGYTPMLYANKDMLQSNMNAGAINSKVWLANYTTRTSYTGDYEYWQYSSTGSVNGIDGNVDCNFWYSTGNRVYNGVDYGPVFNAKYYLDKYPDVKKAFGNDEVMALQHFINNGMREGRQGREMFDVNYYKSSYADLQRSYGNNLKGYYLHYLNNGMKEGRHGCDFFDVFSYRGRYIDLQNTYGNDLPAYYLHYIYDGQFEGRDGSLETSMHNVTFMKAGKAIETQSVQFGHAASAPNVTEKGATVRWDKDFSCITKDTIVNMKLAYKYNGTDYTPVFDADYYLNKYPDLKRAFGTDRNKALLHFVNNGMREGRQGCPEFEVYSYRGRYADLRRAYGTRIENYYMHYLVNGIKEERDGSLNNNTYTVNFVSDGKVISTQTVSFGQWAQNPSISKAGATLKGWDTPYNCITQDTSVNAIWAYVYGGVDYTPVFDPQYYLNKYQDLKRAFGNDGSKALAHFVNNGMREGRQARAEFEVYSYRGRYADLIRAYGLALQNYYMHYLSNGIREGRDRSYIDTQYTVTFLNEDTVISTQTIGFGQNALAPRAEKNAATLVGWDTPYNCITENITVSAVWAYYYNGVNYADVFDADYYLGHYADLRRAFGNDGSKALAHFVNNGMREGRLASEEFNLANYKARYADLQNAYGHNNQSYYLHYIYNGKREGRIAS